jgi:AcrR family transcriptional regulator
MARTPGARNADYDEERLALARKVRPLMVGPGGLRSSLREMAAAASTSVATLKHYFHDREGVLEGVMECLRVDSSPYLAIASSPSGHDVHASLVDYLQRIKTAWFKYGVGAMQAASLAAGLTTSSLGPTYVNYLLEPLLQTAEQRLRRHVEQGDLKPCNERYAALQLLAPVVLGLLHQDSLSGASCRPLDLDPFLAEHVDQFLRAHPATAKGRQAG